MILDFLYSAFVALSFALFASYVLKEVMRRE